MPNQSLPTCICCFCSLTAATSPSSSVIRCCRPCRCTTAASAAPANLASAAAAASAASACRSANAACAACTCRRSDGRKILFWVRRAAANGLGEGVVSPEQPPLPCRSTTTPNPCSLCSFSCKIDRQQAAYTASRAAILGSLCAGTLMLWLASHHNQDCSPSTCRYLPSPDACHTYKGSP